MYEKAVNHRNGPEETAFLPVRFFFALALLTGALTAWAVGSGSSTLPNLPGPPVGPVLTVAPLPTPPVQTVPPSAELLDLADLLDQRAEAFGVATKFQEISDLRVFGFNVE